MAIHLNAERMSFRKKSSLWDLSFPDRWKSPTVRVFKLDVILNRCSLYSVEGQKRPEANDRIACVPFSGKSFQLPLSAFGAAYRALKSFLHFFSAFPVNFPSYFSKKMNSFSHPCRAKKSHSCVPPSSHAQLGTHVS